MEESYIDNPNEFGLKSGSLVLLCKRIGDYLERCYPGWAWAIDPNERGGVINITSLLLHARYGICVKIKDVQDDPRLTQVRKYAGELLERANLTRGAHRHDEWQDRITDIAGNTLLDLSDKSTTSRKQERDRAISEAVRKGMARFETTDEGGTRHVILRHDSAAADR